MTTPKFNNFKTWLEDKSYWEQYLWQVALSKGALDGKDLDQCYKYLQEDFALLTTSTSRTSIVFGTLDFDKTDPASEKIFLEKLNNLKNVNAIDNSCEISFSKGLTIIYGDNGTGKSGVGRLFSNACRSRYSRRILPDARSSSGAGIREAKADFHIMDSAGTKVVHYTAGDNHTVLKSFLVFDRESALAHLSQENKIEFIPSRLQVFDAVSNGLSDIEAKHVTETARNRKDNPVENLFTETSSIKEFLDSLSHKTTDVQIESAITFTDEDERHVVNTTQLKAEKQKLDIPKKKKEIEEDCTALTTFYSNLSKFAVLTQEKADSINALISDIKEKGQLVSALSAKTFEFSAFKHIGSAEWKSLIVAAQKLYEKEFASHENRELENCLLCRQTLSKTEKTLFNNYWDFLKSTAETELKEAKDNLKVILDSLIDTETKWPSFSEAEIPVKIMQRDDQIGFEKIKSAFSLLKAELNKWIENIQKEQGLVYGEITLSLNLINTLVAKKRDDVLKLQDPSLDIKRLSNEILTLSHKKQAFGLIQKIKDYVAWLRWQNLAKQVNFSTIKSGITRKKTDLMKEIVISKYVEVFNKETERLDCKFGLSVESRGKDQQTITGLKLDFARGHNPTEILSEGEQTVSALADFLAEAQLDNNNSGIIFDDPVSSLDHGRRTTIARRIVDEAKERQVIVFTHDIVLFFEMQSHADRESVKYSLVSMRKGGAQIGIVNPDLPWIAQNVKDRVGYLRNELPKLKKA